MPIVYVRGIVKVYSMQMTGYSRRISYLLLFFSLAISACTNNLFTGPDNINKPPEVWLTSGPVEGDTLLYKIHFYWSGWDPDGEIAWFELAVAEGNPFGFNPEDTTGVESWTKGQRREDKVLPD